MDLPAEMPEATKIEGDTKFAGDTRFAVDTMFALNRFGMTRAGIVALVGALAFVGVGCGGGGSESRQLPPPPDVAAPPADALKTTSGLFIRVLQQGTGTRHPRATDSVTVHYTGWTTDGKTFDSSVTRGEPATFRLDGRDCGLDGRGSAHGGRGKGAPLDSRAARVRRGAGPATGHARVRHRADQDRKLTHLTARGAPPSDRPRSRGEPGRGRPVPTPRAAGARLRRTPSDPATPRRTAGS